MAFEKLATSLNEIMILANGVTKAADNAATAVGNAMAKVPQLLLPGIKAVDEAHKAMGDSAEKVKGHWFIIKSHSEQVAQDVQHAANSIGQSLDGALSHTQQTAGSIGTLVQNTVNNTGQLLEDLIAHQKDKIKAIEDTAFGKYLDQYKTLVEHQAGFSGSTSPQDRIETDRSLQGVEKIIRDYTGKAGMDFSFQQFKQDILDLLKNANGLTPGTPMTGGKPIGGASSGGAGSPSAACSGDKLGGSLSLGWNRGVLK